MKELSFVEVISNIKKGEEYILVGDIYRLKKIIMDKYGMIEFKTSDYPIRVSEKERYFKKQED